MAGQMDSVRGVAKKKGAVVYKKTYLRKSQKSQTEKGVVWKRPKELPHGSNGGKNAYSDAIGQVMYECIQGQSL